MQGRIRAVGTCTLARSHAGAWVPCLFAPHKHERWTRCIRRHAKRSLIGCCAPQCALHENAQHEQTGGWVALTMCAVAVQQDQTVQYRWYCARNPPLRALHAPAFRAVATAPIEPVRWRRSFPRWPLPWRWPPRGGAGRLNSRWPPILELNVMKRKSGDEISPPVLGIEPVRRWCSQPL